MVEAGERKQFVFLIHNYVSKRCYFLKMCFCGVHFTPMFTLLKWKLVAKKKFHLYYGV